MLELTTESPIAQKNAGELFDIGSLMSVLDEIEDPRKARGVR